ncbi:MAG TPA: NAD(P)-dependent alcohol dehydrogenase [Steroidobacteraceae bacterium]|nr:NAD(P)-dependent alcohol dehydrogenase [Steroidobacteraceae bacterium]
MSLLRKILLSILGVIVLGIAGLAVALSHNSPCGAAPTAAPKVPMKAAVNRCYGSADVVRVEAVERPVPADHGVLVRVHASSVNPLDWHFMLGEPYVMRAGSGWGSPKDVYLGTDFAGTVVAVGRLVTRFKVGDEVFGGGDGAFAEYLRIPETQVIALKPSNVSFEEAAATPVAGITALQALRDVGHVHAGDKVLVNGAGGGVGTFAVQVARALGASVTGVTSTANLERVRSLGADQVQDYTTQDFTQGAERYDVIFDLSGNHSLSAYRRVLSPGGTYIMVGDTDKGAWLGPLQGLAKTLIVSKFSKQRLMPVFASLSGPTDLMTLAAMMQSGKLKPVIDRRYDLDRVADAIRYQQTGHASGKVIVTMN